VTIRRSFDGPERPVGRLGGAHEERRVTRSWRMAIGTLACPACDVPVAPAGGPLRPAQALHCPYCGHGAAVRDFLSLSAPARPARVEVRVVQQPPVTDAPR
jgi:hypothetical protein